MLKVVTHDSRSKFITIVLSLFPQDCAPVPLILAEGQVQCNKSLQIQGQGHGGDPSVSLQVFRANHLSWSLLIPCPMGIMVLWDCGYHNRVMSPSSQVQPLAKWVPD